MLIIRESECEVYENSLCQLGNFSAYLKPFKNKNFIIKKCNTHTHTITYKAPREMLQGTHSIISSKNKIFKAKEKQYENENKTDLALQQEKG